MTAAHAQASCFCAGNVKGVDSTAESHEALDAAQQLAKEYSCIVAVSGATDLVGHWTWLPCILLATKCLSNFPLASAHLSCSAALPLSQSQAPEHTGLHSAELGMLA